VPIANFVSAGGSHACRATAVLAAVLLAAVLLDVLPDPLGRIIRLRERSRSCVFYGIEVEQGKTGAKLHCDARGAMSAAMANAWHRVPTMIGFSVSRGWSRRKFRSGPIEGWAPPGDVEKGSAMAEKSTASVETGSTASAPVEPRDEVASRLVDRFAIWSGVAGLVPVPVVDVVAVGGLQVQMLRRLSQIYEVPFSENRGKALIAALAGALVPTTSGIGAFSLLKAVPIVGTIIGGFVTPVLSAGATYAIGKAFIQHFESGGTLLDFNPPDYREFVKSHKEMWDSRAKGSGGSTTGAAATRS